MAQSSAGSKQSAQFACFSLGPPFVLAGQKESSEKGPEAPAEGRKWLKGLLSGRSLARSLFNGQADRLATGKSDRRAGTSVLFFCRRRYWAFRCNSEEPPQGTLHTQVRTLFSVPDLLHDGIPGVLLVLAVFSQWKIPAANR